MASSTIPFPTSVTCARRHRHNNIPATTASTAADRNQTILRSSSKLDLCCLFLLMPLKPKSRLGRCHATSPGQPPELEPPSNNHENPSSGVAASLSRFQDTLQIFVAVLFWMSLFFWSSAWDGRNNGRPNKGPRFRK